MKDDTVHFDSGLDFFQDIEGSGTISWGKRAFSAAFSLRVLPDYSIEIGSSLSLSRHEGFELLRENMSGEHADRFGIMGDTKKGYEIRCEGARRKHSSLSLERDPATMQVSATPLTKIRIRNKRFREDEGCKIAFGIMNLDDDTDISLSFHVGSYTFSALAVPARDQILSRIKNEEIPRAVTYEFTTDLDSMSEVQDLEELVYRLTLMLSVIKLNDIKPFYSVVRNELGDIVSATLYTDLRETTFINSFNIIDDEHIRGGTEGYVNSCYDAFCSVHEKVNLHPFVYDLLFASRTRECHIKIVVLILGLEYLVTHYGRNVLHWPEDKKGNLVDKLVWLNKEIRCIPKKYLGQKFVGEIRNPLIHTGIIVNVPTSELVETLYDLYRLSALVFLRLIGYSGTYLNFSWPPKLNAMPAMRQES